ncbi:MAG: hypothetical protein ACK5OB_05385 [Pirellula sp.]
MQSKTTIRSRFYSGWLSSTVAVLVFPLPSALAQSPVPLKVLKPLPAFSPIQTTQEKPVSSTVEPAFALAPLPGQQSSSNPPSPTVTEAAPTVTEVAASVTETKPSVADEAPVQRVEMQTLTLKELSRTTPTVTQAFGQSWMTSDETEAVSVASSNEAVSATQEPQEPKEGLKGRMKDFLDVNRLIGRPATSYSLFQDLETDQKFQQTATLAEPIRTVRDVDAATYMWNAHGYAWESASFCYSPLYFEQPNLERYGQGVGRPFASTVSAVKFGADIVTLPVALVCTPPWECSCTLGHHRPGNCAPYQRKTKDH